MSNPSRWPAGLILCAALLWPGALEQPARADDIPFETIEKGENSGFLGTGFFSGGTQLVINKRDAWEDFWALHNGPSRMRPLPEVNFGRETVVVVTLGSIGSGDGPSIEITRVDEFGGGTLFQVLGDPRPGSEMRFVNPYHIIRVRRVKGPITFIHTRLPELFCNLEFPCRSLSHFCNISDASCQAPILAGICEFISQCETDVDPVCGCDGVTYNNDCQRIQAGAILAHVGSCP